MRNFLPFPSIASPDFSNETRLEPPDPPVIVDTTISMAKLLVLISKSKQSPTLRDYNPDILERKLIVNPDFVQEIRYSAKETIFSPPTVWEDNDPMVEINGRRVKLDIRATLNARKGKIDLSRAYPLRRAFNWAGANSGDSYSFLIPYADAKKTGKSYDPGDIAIIVSSGDFLHFMKIIKMTGHTLEGKESYYFDFFNTSLFSKYAADRDKLDMIYEEAPLWIIAKLPGYKRVADLKTILKGRVDSWGSNEELAVLKILRSFKHKQSIGDADYNMDQNKAHIARIKNNADYLLTALTEPFENDKLYTTAERLFDTMHDWGGADNFSAMIIELWLLWQLSKYAKPDYKEYLIPKSKLPILIDFKNVKRAGFFETNMNFEFVGKYMKVTKFEKGKVHNISCFIVWIETDKTESYLDMFRPVEVVSPFEIDGTLKIPDLPIPVLFLKAVDDKAFWENLETGVGIAIDVLTMLTGLGNLFKLRYLVRAGRTLRVTIAGLEVVSSAISIALAIIDDCDDPDDDYCNALRTLMTILELASLSSDIVLTQVIRRSALDVNKILPPNQLPELVEEIHRLGYADLAEIYKQYDDVYLGKSSMLAKLSDDIIEHRRKLIADFLNSEEYIRDSVSGAVATMHKVRWLVNGNAEIVFSRGRNVQVWIVDTSFRPITVKTKHAEYFQEKARKVDDKSQKWAKEYYQQDYTGHYAAGHSTSTKWINGIPPWLLFRQSGLQNAWDFSRKDIWSSHENLLRLFNNKLKKNFPNNHLDISYNTHQSFIYDGEFVKTIVTHPFITLPNGKKIELKKLLFENRDDFTIDLSDHFPSMDALLQIDPSLN